MLLNLQWLRVNDVATDDGHFGFDLPDLPSRDSHVVDRDHDKISKLPNLDRGDVPLDVEFGGSGGSLAGLRIGLPNQPSPEGDKEPPCQGNQRSQ